MGGPMKDCDTGKFVAPILKHTKLPDYPAIEEQQGENLERIVVILWIGSVVLLAALITLGG
jgi:hypothetical protein